MLPDDEKLPALSDSETVAYWSDGTWCFKEDLEEYLIFMSDDYLLGDFEDVFIERKQRC